MILGAVLAGGEARRFGSDKALALLDGKPMIDHVIDALGKVADAVIVCGRVHDGHVAVPDQPRPGVGPLGGLAAALAEANKRDVARVLTLPCDTPRVDAALLARLAGHRRPAYLLECPIIGIWPSSLAQHLSDWLSANGDRSVRGWAQAVGAQGLAWPAPLNVNRIDDFEKLSCPAATA